MAKITVLKNKKTNEKEYPVTVPEAILCEDNKTLQTKLLEMVPTKLSLLSNDCNFLRAVYDGETNTLNLFSSDYVGV